MDGQQEHQHTWIYVDGLMLCTACRALRIPYPGEAERYTVSELNIRHDGEESDL